MAVSWYSPSAILTPGGVAAGLSDLGQVIASAPERQAQIQRQMEADARAKRDQAIQEIQLGASYAGPDEGLTGIAEQQRREREAVALQRKMAADLAAANLERERDLATYRPIERAYKTGIIQQGTGDMLRPDVAQAQGLWQSMENERRAAQQRAAELDALKLRGERAKMVYAGDMDVSELPFTEYAGGLSSMMRGAKERAMKDSKSQAEIDYIKRGKGAISPDEWNRREALKQQNRIALAEAQYDNRRDLLDFTHGLIDAKTTAAGIRKRIYDLEASLPLQEQMAKDDPEMADMVKMKRDILNKLKADLMVLSDGGVNTTQDSLSNTPQAANGMVATKGTKSLSQAMDLPINQGKTREAVQADMERLGYTVAP